MRRLMLALGYTTYLTLTVVLLFTLSNISFLMLRWLLPEDSSPQNTPVQELEVFKNSDWDFREHFAVFQPGLRFEPFTLWRRLPISSKTTNVNHLGIRSTWQDPNVPAADSDSIIKIYVLGGSTAWGSGAPDDETIPSWIARHLSKKGFHNVKVTNLGESAYASTQGVIQLLLLIQEGEIPHIVIFYDGWNDVMLTVNHGHARWPGQLQRMREIYEQAIPESSGWLKTSSVHAARFLHTFFTQGALVRWLRGELQEAPLPDHGLLPEQLGRIAINRYVANIKTVEALLKAYGFDVYAFWQPSLWTKKTPSPQETELIEGFRSRPHYRRYELPYKEAVRLLRSGEGIPASIIDISDAFDGLEATVFFDYAHVGPMGNKIIAERIVERIVSGKHFAPIGRKPHAS